jgi:hypothetical protein
VLYGCQNPDRSHDYLGFSITAGKQHHGKFMPFDG